MTRRRIVGFLLAFAFLLSSATTAFASAQPPAAADYTMTTEELLAELATALTSGEPMSVEASIGEESYRLLFGRNGQQGFAASLSLPYDSYGLQLEKEGLYLQLDQDLYYATYRDVVRAFLGEIGTSYFDRLVSGELMAQLAESISRMDLSAYGIQYSSETDGFALTIDPLQLLRPANSLLRGLLFTDAGQRKGELPAVLERRLMNWYQDLSYRTVTIGTSLRTLLHANISCLQLGDGYHFDATVAGCTLDLQWEDGKLAGTFYPNTQLEGFPVLYLDAAYSDNAFHLRVTPSFAVEHFSFLSLAVSWEDGLHASLQTELGTAQLDADEEGIAFNLSSIAGSGNFALDMEQRHLYLDVFSGLIGGEYYLEYHPGTLEGSLRGNRFALTDVTGDWKNDGTLLNATQFTFTSLYGGEPLAVTAVSTQPREQVVRMELNTAQAGMPVSVEIAAEASADFLNGRPAQMLDAAQIRGLYGQLFGGDGPSSDSMSLPAE